jgi:hypothetical protein
VWRWTGGRQSSAAAAVLRTAAATSSSAFERSRHCCQYKTTSTVRSGSRTHGRRGSEASSLSWSIPQPNPPYQVPAAGNELHLNVQLARLFQKTISHGDVMMPSPDRAAVPGQDRDQGRRGVADDGDVRVRRPGPGVHNPPDGERPDVGSIAALFGLSHGLISQEQYSQLVTVVILSALVPTIIAQRYFEPDVGDLLGVNETSGEEDFTSFVTQVAAATRRDQPAEIRASRRSASRPSESVRSPRGPTGASAVRRPGRAAGTRGCPRCRRGGRRGCGRPRRWPRPRRRAT